MYDGPYHDKDPREYSHTKYVKDIDDNIILFFIKLAVQIKSGYSKISEVCFYNPYGRSNTIGIVLRKDKNDYDSTAAISLQNVTSDNIKDYRLSSFVIENYMDDYIGTDKIKRIYFRTFKLKKEKLLLLFIKY